ncbi:hypothetical protein BJ742DRAFT_898244 [Cladochytrium replicatum]|nr:hypothetical protein BJ742DRAFT_898244 [Cladochytrium replicatum]
MRSRHAQVELIHAVTAWEKASQCGFVAALDLLLQGPLSNKTSHVAMDIAMDVASDHGHVEVLEWWKSGGPELCWSDEAMCDASTNGHARVLECCTRMVANERLSYYTLAMLLIWRLGREVDGVGLVELEWVGDAVNLDCSGSGQQERAAFEDWWKSSGLTIDWTSKAMDEASGSGSVEALDWSSGLELKWTSKSMDDAGANGHLEVLDWWSASGLERKWTSGAMDRASRTRSPRVLD